MKDDFVRLTRLKAHCIGHQKSARSCHFNFIKLEFRDLCYCYRKVCTCSFLAGIGKVIIAWYIIPLPILMPYYNNTVFSSRKEAVWLIWSPVLILLQKRGAKPLFPVLEYIYIPFYRRTDNINFGEEQSQLFDSGY